MDKKELRQDLVRDRIIQFIEFLSEQSLYVMLFLVLLIVGISSYSFLSNKKDEKADLSSELSGLAQSEYNQGDTIFAVEDLQQVLNDYEDTNGGTQAYMYLIYDAYINDDSDRLQSLLDNYSIYSQDSFLRSSILETKAYLSANNSDYDSAIEILDKALKISEIEDISNRLSIAKARVLISSQEYKKALKLIEDLDSNSLTTIQENAVAELQSYISHIQN